MLDTDCVAFLQWALPRLGLRWRGYRRVRRQVCKRVQRRIDALGMSLQAYRERVERDPAERVRLDGLCRITISRFYRDQGLWRRLEGELLPALARAAAARSALALRAWSVGCASGEEPYSLALVWNLRLRPRLSALALEILATDSDPVMLERAARACYPRGALKELPEAWSESAFEPREQGYCLRPEHKAPVRLLAHDLRAPPPGTGFDLVLCRNLAFTYFETDLQRRSLGHIAAAMRPGGALVVGAHEALPGPHPGLTAAGGPVYRRDPPPGPE